jgi:hypothetical protein
MVTLANKLNEVIDKLNEMENKKNDWWWICKRIL